MTRRYRSPFPARPACDDSALPADMAAELRALAADLAGDTVISGRREAYDFEAAANILGLSARIERATCIVTPAV